MILFFEVSIINGSILLKVKSGFLVFGLVEK